MKRLILVVLGVMCAAGMWGMAVAGSMDSPGAPSSGSGMHTIGQLHDYLNSGTDSSIPGGFQEPAGIPGPTMKTLEEIYQDIKAKLDQCKDTTAADVMPGKPFFCTKPGSWGVQTGNYATPTPTITPTITPTVTPIPWTLNSANCNATAGWSWLNGACWSDAIADSVSWNNLGNDTSNTGSYTCNSAGTLQSRMEAAVAGRWSEICTNINSRGITTSDNGTTGIPYISAMAIADCVDGTRDIGPTITGSPDDWAGRSNVLKTWATASGHTALPAVDYNGENNQYDTACGLAGGTFYQNTSTTFSPGTNWCWGAACGSTSGAFWSGDARVLGSASCSDQHGVGTSYPLGDASFRVVARPAE